MLSKRVPDQGNLRPRNPYDVKSAGEILRQMVSHQVDLGHPADRRLFFSVDCREGGSHGLVGPVFDFHKYEIFPVFCYQVDFSQAAAKVALQYAISLLFQVSGGSLLKSSSYFSFVQAVCSFR